LRTLRLLEVTGTQVSDISFLKELPDLDYVDVRDNALDISPESDAMLVLAELEERGVTVFY